MWHGPVENHAAGEKRETILRFASQRLAVAALLHHLGFQPRSGRGEHPQSPSDRREKRRESMAKSTTQEPRGQRPGFAFDAIPGMDPASFAANLEPFFQAGTKALDTWREVSEELLEFGKSRLTRNMEMSRKLTQSPSLDKA